MAGSKIVRFRVGAWRFEDAETTKMVVFTLLWYDGANSYTASIRYNIPETKWEYLDYTNAWVDLIATHVLAAETWHTFEIDVDFDLGKYVRLIVDDRPLVIGVAVYAAVDATEVGASVTLETTTAGAAAAEARFDDIKIQEISE
jgi:hypothetical protein